MKAILAINKEGYIGKNNKLLYHISEDLRWFKLHTTYKIVVMGRKTFESMHNTPLPNRINIVITSTPDKYDIIEGVRFMTLEDIKILSKEYTKDFWVIGGKTIYEQLAPYITDWYITEIESSEEKGDCLLNTEIYSHKHKYLVESFVKDLINIKDLILKSVLIKFLIYSDNENIKERIEEEKEIFNNIK